jgi:hypothetical protein
MLVLVVKRFFDKYFFGHKVDYGGVSILRWDLCFNQVYQSREESLKALEYIKLKNNKKSDVKNYEYGIIQLTKTNYLKIYHKGEEYKKHDQAKVKIYNDNFEAMAERILRYEKKLTPKNVAYFYNTKFKYQNQPLLVKEYLKAKVKGKVTPQMRKDFELVQQFTLGNSKMKGHVKLDEFLFNHLYSLFREEIKKKFNHKNKRLALAGVCRFDSRANDLLQIVDLLIGAVTYDIKYKKGKQLVITKIRNTNKQK